MAELYFVFPLIWMQCHSLLHRISLYNGIEFIIKLYVNILFSSTRRYIIFHIDGLKKYKQTMGNTKRETTQPSQLNYWFSGYRDIMMNNSHFLKTGLWAIITFIRSCPWVLITEMKQHERLKNCIPRGLSLFSPRIYLLVLWAFILLKNNPIDCGYSLGYLMNIWWSCWSLHFKESSCTNARYWTFK